MTRHPATLGLTEGDHRLERIECAVTEKETAPPKPYTEGTLIADMASIAKYVTDPEVKAILKQRTTERRASTAASEPRPPALHHREVEGTRVP